MRMLEDALHCAFKWKIFFSIHEKSISFLLKFLVLEKFSFVYRIFGERKATIFVLIADECARTLQYLAFLSDRNTMPRNPSQ